MKILRVLLISLFLIYCYNANCQSKYFDDYRPIADSLSVIYEIPSSFILAIAYHESGAGTSVVARRLNNHFGMKGRVPGGDTVAVKSSYKYFTTANESYNYFCKLVSSKKFYPTLKGNPDYKKWVIALSHTGYAGNAKLWSRQIIQIVERNKLDE
jgi:hypothetical protein